MSKLLLIDGHSILNRAFYGVPDLTNSEGIHTNAMYGFLNIMFKFIDEEKPDYVTVAFDLSAPTFRHKVYDGYKGTRKPMLPELRQQVPLMKELLTAMNITIVEKEGFEVQLLDVGPIGTVTAQQVADAIREDTCLVTVMYANNEIGSILPIAEIGRVCREAGVLFHTDAVQAAGHLPIDVEKQHIDMLSLSGHKFHGPRGTGLLYVRRGVPLLPLIEGGAQERGKRAGTENLPAIAGMAVALKDACDHMQEDTQRQLVLRERLIAGLSKIPHSALNGDPVRRLPGNVSFCFEGIEGESMLLLLDDKGIAASSGSACTSGSLDPSHVLLAIGRPHEVAHGSLRLTLGAETTQEEIDYTIQSVAEVVQRLRAMSPVWDELQKGVRSYVIQ